MCPSCGGGDEHKQGCQACHGSGLESVTACPFKLIDAEFFDLAEWTARQARSGTWPVSGGWLDQTKACVDAVDLFRAHFPARPSEQ